MVKPKSPLPHSHSRIAATVGPYRDVVIRNAVDADLFSKFALALHTGPISSMLRGRISAGSAEIVKNRINFFVLEWRI